MKKEDEIPVFYIVLSITGEYRALDEKGDYLNGWYPDQDLKGERFYKEGLPIKYLGNFNKKPIRKFLRKLHDWLSNEKLPKTYFNK